MDEALTPAGDRTPPDDADDWSNEQWIEWLKSTDGEPVGDEGAEERVPMPYVAARSTGGQLLGNAMMGLARALYGPQDEKPAIVVESDSPGSDEEFELHLDFENPDQSYAVRRREGR